MSKKKELSLPFWTDPQGKALTCTEKLRTLRQNEAEFKNVMQDTYDDAILIGVDPVIIRERLAALIDQVDYSLQNKKHHQDTEENQS